MSMDPEELRKLAKQMRPGIDFVRQHHAMMSELGRVARYLHEDLAQLKYLQTPIAQSAFTALADQRAIIAQMTAAAALAQSSAVAEAIKTAAAIDTSAMTKAVEAAARVDTAGMARALKAVAAIDASRMTLAIRAATEIQTSTMAQALKAAIEIDASAIAQATQRFSELSTASWMDAAGVASSLDRFVPAWTSALSQAVAAGELAVSHRLSVLATRPPLVLRQVATEVRASAEETGDEVEKRAAQTGIGVATVATEIVSDLSISVVRKVPPDAIIPSTDTSSLPPFNLPALIVRETQDLIRSDPHQLDNPDLYREVSTYQLARVLASTVHMIQRVNSLWSLGGAEEKLFKYTDQSVEARLSLTQFWDVTAHAFCQIIRWLYFILYEGAGADNLRFLEPGLVTSDEAEVVFDVKQFRMYHCDHDREHGSASDIRDKEEKLRSLCERYIGVPLPATAEHFGTILIKLLERVGGFLDLVCERLEQQNGSDTTG